MSESGSPSENEVKVQTPPKPEKFLPGSEVSPSVIAKIASRLEVGNKLNPVQSQTVEQQVKQSPIYGGSEAVRQITEMPAVPREGDASNAAVTQENPNVALNKIGMPDTMAETTRAALSNPDLTETMKFKDWAMGVGGRAKPSEAAPVSPSAVTRPAEKVVEVQKVVSENPTPLANPEPIRVQQEMPATPAEKANDPNVDPDTGLHRAEWDSQASV